MISSARAMRPVPVRQKKTDAARKRRRDLSKGLRIGATPCNNQFSEAATAESLALFCPTREDRVPPNDIEFSGEPQCLKKRDDGARVRCNELLCGRNSGRHQGEAGT